MGKMQGGPATQKNAIILPILPQSDPVYPVLSPTLVDTFLSVKDLEAEKMDVFLQILPFSRKGELFLEHR